MVINIILYFNRFCLGNEVLQRPEAAEKASLTEVFIKQTENPQIREK